VNIERSKHLSKLKPFLEKNNPDVVCFQEIKKMDLDFFKKILKAKYVFSPMTDYSEKSELSGVQGIAIFSKYKIVSSSVKYYIGNKNKIPNFIPKNKTGVNFMLLILNVLKNKEIFKIITTHFPVTPDGDADSKQRNAVKKIMSILENEEEFVFCGDINAPRGREIFSVIESKYKDNIPKKYKTTIDGKIHRAGNLQLVVDCMFSTKKYKVTNVSLVSGVSDHLAVKAKISKKKILLK
jgi:exonuclease III